MTQGEKKTYIIFSPSLLRSEVCFENGLVLYSVSQFNEVHFPSAYHALKRTTLYPTDLRTAILATRN